MGVLLKNPLSYCLQLFCYSFLSHKKLSFIEINKSESNPQKPQQIYLMSLQPLNIRLSFSQPSFHPVLHLTFNAPSFSVLDDASNSVTEKIKSCEPVAHLEIALPDALFVDPDELNGKWPLSYSSEPTMHQASGGNWEVSDWKLDPPSVDIERPSFGSPALRHTLYLSMRPQAFFEESDIKSEVEMEIPLHARYLAPSDEGKRTLLFPGDDGSEIRSGWTCASELTQSKFSF